MPLDALLTLPDGLVVGRVRLYEATLLDEATGGEIAIRAPACDANVSVLDLLNAGMPTNNPMRQIGDVGRSGQRHRVLFGQQLTDTMVQRVLLAVWPTHVGEIRTVMVTTSPTDRVFLPGIAVRLVPLGAAFRVRGGGLVADEAVWTGVLAALPTTAGLIRIGPFAQDFRDVLLPGESLTIALTPAQSALLRVLWEHRGVPLHREVLIARANLDLDKPVQAFPRPKYPDANRAYRALVRSNRQGQYWLSHATATCQK